MRDFCEEEVDLLSVFFYRSKQEVEFKDKQEFGGSEIRTSCLLG